MAEPKSDRIGCAGKVRYRTRIDALIALADTTKRKPMRTDKDERRPYRCESCFGWHLTSWSTRWRP